MKLKCIVVDDEPLALDIMQDYISRVPFLEFRERFENALDAINYLKSNNIPMGFNPSFFGIIVYMKLRLLEIPQNINGYQSIFYFWL